MTRCPAPRALSSESKSRQLAPRCVPLWENRSTGASSLEGTPLERGTHSGAHSHRSQDTPEASTEQENNELRPKSTTKKELDCLEQPPWARVWGPTNTYQSTGRLSSGHLLLRRPKRAIASAGRARALGRRAARGLGGPQRLDGPGTPFDVVDRWGSI